MSANLNIDIETRPTPADVAVSPRLQVVAGGTPAPPRVGAARGTAPCGLSIFSSYASGVGAVLALDERIEVAVRVIFGRGPHAGGRESLAAVSDPYLVECGRLAFEAARAPLPEQIEAEVRSDVPTKSGLKTSSAVAAAFIGATLKAAGHSPQDAEVVSAAAAASRKARVTQAGSMDDTWCSVLGGVVIADRRGGPPLAHWAAPEGCEIVILVPENSGARVHKLDRRALLAPYAGEFEALAARLVATRDIFGVMSEAASNTARAFGYGKELLDAALGAGALGVSLSGKGPAVGAVTRAGEAERVLGAWRAWRGRVIRTRPTSRGLATADARLSRAHTS